MTNIYKFADEKKIDMENVGYINEDLEVFSKNPVQYYEKWNAEEMRVAEENYEFPRWDKEKQVVRAKTREEFIYEDDKLEYLLDGEILENGKIKKIEIPKNLMRAAWDKEKKVWIETIAKEELMNLRKEKILKYAELKKEIATLEEFAEEFESDNTIEMLKKQMEQLKKEINELLQIIKKM